MLISNGLEDAVCQIRFSEFSEVKMQVHCILVIALMLGAKRIEHYNEMSIITKWVISTVQIVLNICTGCSAPKRIQSTIGTFNCGSFVIE